MGAKTLIINMLLIGLFALSIITFASQFGIENDSAVNVLSDSRINDSYGELQSELSEVDNTGSTQKDTFEAEDPDVGDENLIFSSIKTIWTTLSTTLIGLYNVTFGLVFDTFLGSGFGIVAGVIAGILSILIVLFGWQLFRTGRSE